MKLSDGRFHLPETNQILVDCNCGAKLMHKLSSKVIKCPKCGIYSHVRFVFRKEKKNEIA